MLSPHEWWSVIRSYNQSIFPMQIIVMLIGIISIIYLIMGSNSKAESKNCIDLKRYKDIFQIKKDAVLATSSADGFPNIVPIHSKHVISNKKVLISDQFMNKTKNNILQKPYAVLTIIDKGTLYKISGKCDYKTSGILYALAARGAKKYAKSNAQNKSVKINCKGIILMKVNKFEKETI